MTTPTLQLAGLTAFLEAMHFAVWDILEYRHQLYEQKGMVRGGRRS